MNSSDKSGNSHLSSYVLTRDAEIRLSKILYLAFNRLGKIEELYLLRLFLDKLIAGTATCLYMQEIKKN